MLDDRYMPRAEALSELRSLDRQVATQHTRLAQMEEWRLAQTKEAEQRNAAIEQRITDSLAQMQPVITQAVAQGVEMMREHISSQLAPISAQVGQLAPRVERLEERMDELAGKLSDVQVGSVTRAANTEVTAVQGLATQRLQLDSRAITIALMVIGWLVAIILAMSQHITLH